VNPGEDQLKDTAEHMLDVALDLRHCAHRRQLQLPDGTCEKVEEGVHAGVVDVGWREVKQMQHVP
jgi:hypothetical protein